MDQSIAESRKSEDHVASTEMWSIEKWLETIEAIASDSSDCEGFARFTRENVNGIWARTSEEPMLWVTFVGDGSGEVLSAAVTGNGPTSEANARFFANARPIVLALVAEVRHLTTTVESLASQLAIAMGHRDVPRADQIDGTAEDER